LSIAVRGTFVLYGLLCLATPAPAHDLITAAEVQRYLAEVEQNIVVIKSHQPAPRRAEANVALGRMLDEIRELLNRDVASHGQVNGLPSNLLMRELKAKGAPLAFSTSPAHFLANVQYYQAALRLGPDGMTGCEATLRWTRGYFYDSFDDDPLEPRGQSWEQLREQIDLGERYVQGCVQHPDMEEGRFILLVHYVQAARGANDPGLRAKYALRGRDGATEFRSRYPESLRAAAVSVLVEKLPQGAH